MVDLNALIPPESGMQLTLAETINDNGEIAVNGTPTDCDVVEQCGHAILLIPCDEDHPGIEGCDYSILEAAAPPIRSGVPATSEFPGSARSAAANTGSTSIQESFGPWHSPANTLTLPLHKHSMLRRHSFGHLLGRSLTVRD